MEPHEGFVGRDRQIRELTDIWRSARRGRGAFVVVSGEAGIGKTRLVEQFVDAVDGDGRVAWGTCLGADGPPLWPWRTILGGSAPAPQPSTPGLEVADPSGGTSRRHAELLEALLRIASEAPIVVVLDDLHRADGDSVALLPLVAREARRLPLLLLATLRGGDIVAGGTVWETLVDLAPATHTIELGGLDGPAVARLAATLTGRTPTTELTRSIVERTGGNPFFVRELLRLVVAEGQLEAALDGGELPVPPLVRDVVLRRVGQLPASTRSALDAAAVLGREAGLGALAAVLGVESAAVIALIEPAEAARLVELGPGRVRFAHDLVRDALVDNLDPMARRELHHAAAGALRATGGPGASAAEIAAHLCAALPVGDPETAAAAALDAARESMALRAPSDAVIHAERGLAALGGSRPAVAGALLLALGDARTTTGDRPGARAAYEEAAGVARPLGDVESLAAAALGFAGVMGSPRTDPARVALLEEAAAALSDRGDALSARVHARLAHALLFSDQHERRLRLAEDALATARRVGDLGALVSTLYVWCIVNAASDSFDARRAAAEELLALGRSSGDDEVEAWALHTAAHHLAEAGDIAGFDAHVAAGEALARRTHSATWQWTALVHRAMRATMQGRFADGEALGKEALEFGVRSQHELAAASFGAHLIALRTWQGRLDELMPIIVASAGRFVEVPAIQAAVPFAHAELGQLPEAANALRQLVDGRGIDDVHRGQSWTVAIAMLARAAALTGDVEVAGRVRSRLLGFADRHVLGPLADCYFGPASLYIGLCAATEGDLDEAAVLLRRAVAQAEAVGARPVRAWARAELATVLERAGAEPGEVETLRAAARAEMEALGIARHLARLTPAAVPATGPATGNVFRPDGGGWEVTYAGRTIGLRPMKGLLDIHRLLARPGVEMHVLELAGAADGRVVGATRQPVLDERAKSAYRERLLALEAEVDEARASADLARLERGEAERDAVVAELAAALGLGGRDRNMADEAERARQAVRARIRYTLDRIASAHPELRRHLDKALVTGTFCSYRPERPTAWITEAGPVLTA